MDTNSLDQNEFTKQLMPSYRQELYIFLVVLFILFIFILIAWQVRFPFTTTARFEVMEQMQAKQISHTDEVSSDRISGYAVHLYFKEVTRIPGTNEFEMKFSFDKYPSKQYGEIGNIYHTEIRKTVVRDLRLTNALRENSVTDSAKRIVITPKLTGTVVMKTKDTRLLQMLINILFSKSQH